MTVNLCSHHCCCFLYFLVVVLFVEVVVVVIVVVGTLLHVLELLLNFLALGYLLS